MPTWMATQETCYAFVLVVFFMLEYLATIDFPFGGILSLCETPELFIKLQSLARASINIGVSSKWVNLQI